jgi:ribose 5-phosphate isomerase A
MAGFDERESAKVNAAEAAVKLVKDGQVLGIGSGSTVEHFIRLLGERIRKEELEVYGVPSSFQSYFLALDSGIRIVGLDEFDVLDLAVDGADEVDSDLNLIKGGGGAFTREKIVDSAAKEFVVIVDWSKKVNRLGEKFPVPVEVLPFAYGYVCRRLRKLGGEPILRKAKLKLGPVISDNGNFIVDVKFSRIKDVKNLERDINNIPGVVDNGIFPSSLVDIVFVGYSDRVEILKRE